MAYIRNGLQMEDLWSVKVDDLTSDMTIAELEQSFEKFGEVGVIGISLTLSMNMKAQ